MWQCPNRGGDKLKGASLKSSVGIFTHQGHISQVGSTVSLTNPGSIASHEKIPDHRDKLLTMSRSLVEGIKGLLSSLSSKEAMTGSAEGCARTLQHIVQEVKAGSASLDPQLHDAKES